MPELPEVETYRRDIAPHLRNRGIVRAELRDVPNAMRIVRRHGPVGFTEQLSGARVARVGRWGKFLFLDLDSSISLVVHLGMSGRLMIVDPDVDHPPHCHVALDLDDGRQLRFVDPRSFGEMFLSPRGEDRPDELKHLGPDPLNNWPDAGEFRAMLRGHRALIKQLLMNQGFVAGLGNIYSDEALHVAGLRHDRRSNEISAAEAGVLHSAIPSILARAIQQRGTSMQDESYRDLNGSLGGFQNSLAVYARQDQPCPACGTPIVRGRWASRSTFYCPRCQG